MSTPMLLVLAGANGAGKSSLGGALLRSRGLDYYSAEDFARQAVCSERVPLEDAVHRGWLEGRRRLESAIADRRSFAIESSLGGTSMPALVAKAAAHGFHVGVWFFGLDSAERHISRVARRAAAGGFPIPDNLVRTRFRRCRENLIALMPSIARLRAFDNSAEREHQSSATPAPRLVLDLDGPTWTVPAPANFGDVPGWAKPVVEAAIQYRGLPATVPAHTV